MTVLAQTLSNDTRIISGLRNNPLFSDTQIVELLNDALNEARDRFVVALGHWFRAVAPFTLTGNVPGSNTFDLTTIPDFQMDQGINWLPGGNAPALTVPRMGSFAERNTNYGGLGWLTGQYREYFTNGDLLFVNPPTSSAGSYELVYTPQGTPLALPVNVSISAVGGTTGFTGPIFAAPTGTFLATDVGLSIQIAGATSSNNNGTFAITVFTDSAHVQLSGSHTSETLPDAAVVTLLSRQPAGTRGDLPAILTPLALFLKVHAGIAIQTSRKQRTNELDGKLLKEEVRILALANKRSEGQRQAPITRGRRRFSGYWG